MKKHEAAIYAIAAIISISLLSLNSAYSAEFEINLNNSISYKELNSVNISYKCALDRQTGQLDCAIPDLRKGSVVVKGTEYVQGQNGTVFLQVLDQEGQPFGSDILCRLKIFDPSKLKILDVGMTELEDGIFFHNLNPVPNEVGVYIVSAECSVPIFQNSSKEFLRGNTTFLSHLDVNEGNSPMTQRLSVGTSFECSTDDNIMIAFEERGNFTNFTYIDTINATLMFSNANALMDLKIRIYDYDVFLDIYTVIGTQTLRGNSIPNMPAVPINFSVPVRTFLDSDHHVVALDWCARTVSGNKAIDLNFNGNTSTTNSSILKSTLTENISIGFQNIRGSSELHVSAPIISQDLGAVLWFLVILIFVIVLFWFLLS